MAHVPSAGSGYWMLIHAKWSRHRENPKLAQDPIRVVSDMFKEDLHQLGMLLTECVQMEEDRQKKRVSAMEDATFSAKQWLHELGL